jgi:molecular chaperone GrpE
VTVQAIQPTPLDPAEKERLLEEFRACLDAWEAAPNEPCPGAEPLDLHTLLAEMAALKSEVRLQSRQFKSALDELRGYGERLNAHNQRLEQELARAREHNRDVRRQAERKVLLELIDLHDRLHAGAQAAARSTPSRLARWLQPGPARLIERLAEGQALTLARAEQALERLHVRAIDAVGQRLDPERMRAVAVESDQHAPDGIVLREARRGFLHDGELLRAAEVVVNKKASHS